MKKYFEILHEDDHIIVLTKAANVLTIPDRHDPTIPNIREVLSRKRDDVYVVHRLDKETSGVMVFAKTAEAHAELSNSWREGAVIKKYLALTMKPSEQQGQIEAALTEHPTKKGQYITAVNGKSSHTSYKVIGSWDRYALVELTLHTGRTHQIRVHMKHIGAPLITDSKYGVDEAFYLSSIKKFKYRKGEQEKPLLSRSSLHASILSFSHPDTKEKMSFEAPLRKDMKAVIYQLRKKFEST